MIRFLNEEIPNEINDSMVDLPSASLFKIFSGSNGDLLDFNVMEDLISWLDRSSC
jgi:hypothetical protein